MRPLVVHCDTKYWIRSCSHAWRNASCFCEQNSKTNQTWLCSNQERISHYGAQLGKLSVHVQMKSDSAQWSQTSGEYFLKAPVEHTQKTTEDDALCLEKLCGCFFMCLEETCCSLTPWTEHIWWMFICWICGSQTRDCNHGKLLAHLWGKSSTWFVQLHKSK